MLFLIFIIRPFYIMMLIITLFDILVYEVILFEVHFQDGFHFYADHLDGGLLPYGSSSGANHDGS